MSPGPRHGMGTMDGEGSHGGQTASGNLACPGGKGGQWRDSWIDWVQLPKSPCLQLEVPESP